MIRTTLSLLIGMVIVTSATAQCNPPPGSGTLVSIQPVVLENPSGLDTTMGAPPAGDTEIPGGSFVIEIWAQQVSASLQGLGVVYLNVNFNEAVMTCSGITVSPNFTDFGAEVGSCSTGAAINFGGGNLTPSTLGKAPQWARVATIDMDSDAAVTGTMITTAAATNPLLTVSIIGCGNVPVARILFGSTVFDIAPVQCTMSSQCTDALFCNGTETCNPGAPGAGLDGCLGGTPPCSFPTPACDESVNMCFQCVTGSDCNDGSLCTSDICQPATHTCTNPTSVNCDDMNICTEDSCIAFTGQCEHVIADCSDGDPCTQDLCNPMNGVCSNPAPIHANLAWNPSLFVDVAVNDVLDIALRVVPTQSSQVLVAGMEVVVFWDPTKLELLGLDNSSNPYAWLLSAFPDDSGIDNLNNGVNNSPFIPFNDGDLFYTALGQFEQPLGVGPAIVPPSGLLVTEFRFRVLSTDPTTISIPQMAGMNTYTNIYWGGEGYVCEGNGLACVPNTSSSSTPECGTPSDNDYCVVDGGVPGCEIDEGLGTVLFLGDCLDVSDCADLNDDFVSDDGCRQFKCNMGVCEATARVFADMGSAGGVCALDDSADANDKFHALNCFSDTNFGSPGQYPCEPEGPVLVYNVDVGGAGLTCCPDGACDQNDAFAALNAFSGTTMCSCPSDPSGVQSCAPTGAMAGPLVVDKVGLSASPGRRIIRPGELVQVNVYMTDATADLRGYQLHLGVSGGRRGGLELVDIAISHRSDSAFSPGQAWTAFNTRTGQMLAGLDGSGVPVRKGTYLATYTYRATEDAAGSFVIDVKPYNQFNPNNRTFLFASDNGTVEVDSTKPAVVVVASARAIAVR